MKEWYQLSSDEVLRNMKTSAEGLQETEAAKRLAEHGENTLAEGKRKTLLQIFLGQFCDLLVLILIIAASVSAVSGNTESTIVIFAVLILNAVLGTVQTVKAEKSLDSLKSLSAPVAKVLRDGSKIEIPSRLIVPGDILLLEAGDLVCADGRLLDCHSLQVNESSLTGESTNVEKASACINAEAALADRINMVYSGSLVTYGRSSVMVTATGMDTEIGKIADLMNAARDRKTPLQVSLDDFSKKLAVIILLICAVIFGLSLYRHMSVIDSMMFAVALAVAAIPEALSSIVTIVQAIGTQKMAKENAIVKDLKAVESLGSVSVICSDKTGTLTQNKMTVQHVYVNHTVLSPAKLNTEDALHRHFVYNAILNNDSAVTKDGDIGDPTETALLNMAHCCQVDENAVRASMHRLEEIPFDSERKLMSSMYHLDGLLIMFTKGALDMLLPKLTHIRTQNAVMPIKQADLAKIEEQNRIFSENGLRVLAFAYREIDACETLSVASERDFTFLGLTAMMDPPREESVASVAAAKRAGIRTIMITGDHKITASAIAKQIGIFEEGDMALTGMELDALSESELNERLEKISVYARVSPENKIRIVEAWQKKGHIVSMTGDGVNDAPALKKADIGVAMGITGTDVSKDAASMILADDNFATIIKAVSNGRNVYQNIKNAVLFLLSGNTAGILSVLYTSLLGLPIPFQPVQLLFINLLTDSLPALAIGMEPSDGDTLLEKPRNPKEGILTKSFMKSLLLQGFLIALCTMAAFYVGLPAGVSYAGTMAFATLTLARLFHGFNCRSKRSLFAIGFSRNPYSLMAFFAGVLLLAAVLFVPFLKHLFLVETLSSAQLVTVAALAFLPTLVIQAGRLFRR